MLSALLLYGVRTFLPPAKTGNQQADLLVEAKVRNFCGKKGKGGAKGLRKLRRQIGLIYFANIELWYAVNKNFLYSHS